MSLARTLRRWIKRNFESAGAGSRWPVPVMMASPHRQVLAARSLTETRANWLVGNTGIAESVVASWANSAIGDGPTVRSNHPNRAMANALEAAWLRAYDSIGIDGNDLASVLTLLSRSMVGAGEGLGRFVTTERGEVKVQVLLPEQVDASGNRDLNGGADGEITAGVERDALGRIVAYWLRPDDWRATTQAVRVDAADVVHLFEQRWPGQLRGISWLAPVATRIVELDALEDAGLTKAKSSALVCGVIRDVDGQSSAVADLNAMMPLEPGAMVGPLPPGADIAWTPVSDMSALDSFTRHMVRSVAAGVGIPYALLSGDYSDSNYSSSRLAMQSFIRRVKAVRASILTARFLRPLWQRFVTLEVLSGRLNAPDFARDPSPYFDCSFLFPEFPHIAPLDETQADALAIQAGIRSRQEVIAARGRDPQEVDDEIAADSFKPATKPGNVVSLTESAA
ncbi:MAG: phage portal protein [Methyloceanibacter sp.]